MYHSLPVGLLELPLVMTNNGILIYGHKYPTSRIQFASFPTNEQQPAIYGIISACFFRIAYSHV